MKAKSKITELTIDEALHDDEILISELHSAWLSLERYLFEVDKHLEKLSASHPEIARKFKLYRASDPGLKPKPVAKGPVKVDKIKICKCKRCSHHNEVNESWHRDSFGVIFCKQCGIKINVVDYSS